MLKLLRLVVLVTCAALIGIPTALTYPTYDQSLPDAPAAFDSQTMGWWTRLPSTVTVRYSRSGMTSPKGLAPSTTLNPALNVTKARSREAAAR